MLKSKRKVLAEVKEKVTTTGEDSENKTTGKDNQKEKEGKSNYRKGKGKGFGKSGHYRKGKGKGKSKGKTIGKTRHSKGKGKGKLGQAGIINSTVWDHDYNQHDNYNDWKECHICGSWDHEVDSCHKPVILCGLSL